MSVHAETLHRRNEQRCSLSVKVDAGAGVRGIDAARDQPSSALVPNRRVPVCGSRLMTAKEVLAPSPQREYVMYE